MDIERIHGGAEGRSRASAWRDLVFAVATAAERTSSVTDQTRQTLDALDEALAEAGSDRSRILSATVYLSDISEKPAMDTVWCEWIGERENWPQRACVQAGLATNTLVEITVVAARDRGS